MLNNEGVKGIEKINLNQLNACIEANRRNMNPSIDYDFLEESSRIMLKTINIENEKSIVPVIVFTREEAISIVLNFFESLDDEELYEYVKSILMGQNKNIGINIFNFSDITNFSEKDENGLRKYSSECQLENRGEKALAKILLKDEFQDFSDHISNEDFVLQDIYDIVHEISHTFDLGNNAKSRKARSLFAEITPYCFERMLGEYLVSNNIVSERTKDKITQRRTECSMRHARSVCAKVNLVKLKEKEGCLTKDNVKNILERNNIYNPFYVKSMFRDVLEYEPSIDFEAKYPIAELTAHQYMNVYKKDKKEAMERLKKYCEEIKRGNLNDEVLKLVGCPTNIKEVEEIANDIRDSRNR